MYYHIIKWADTLLHLWEAYMPRLPERYWKKSLDGWWVCNEWERLVTKEDAPSARES